MVGTAECRKWLSSSHTLGELESLNTVLSALLTICNSAGEALDTGKQTAIMEVVSQLWAFLNIKQVRKTTDPFFIKKQKISKKEDSTEIFQCRVKCISFFWVFGRPL